MVRTHHGSPLFHGFVLVNTHLQAVGMAISQEWDATRSFGAVGIICCRFVDANGQGIVKSPEERLIAATLGNLRKPKKKLLVVCGSDRAQATFVAINGGLVTHLCVGQGLAEELTHL